MNRETKIIRPKQDVPFCYNLISKASFFLEKPRPSYYEVVNVIRAFYGQASKQESHRINERVKLRMPKKKYMREAFSQFSKAGNHIPRF